MTNENGITFRAKFPYFVGKISYSLFKNNNNFFLFNYFTGKFMFMIHFASLSSILFETFLLKQIFIIPDYFCNF